MNTRLCLVRHGETAWNAEGRVQGQLDIPLNATGHAQAQATAEALSAQTFTALYCSDLTRVRQTAAPSAQRLALPLNYDAALRERHYGIFESHTYVDCREKFPEHYARFRDKDMDFDFGTGESLRTFHTRVLEAMQRIAHEHHGETVLVFTHGGVLESVYRHAKAIGHAAPRDFDIPNAGLNWIEIHAKGWDVLTWAAVAHLKSSRDDLRD